jgi:hypothetical protein
MKTFEYVELRFGVTVQPMTLKRAATLSSNRGRARLIVAAPDSWQARQTAAAYNAAANAGTAADRFAVTMRGPGRAVPVISRRDVAQ